MVIDFLSQIIESSEPFRPLTSYQNDRFMPKNSDKPTLVALPSQNLEVFLRIG